MLDLDKVDLGGLCHALEDHSYQSTWWFDPQTGEVEPRFSVEPEEEAEDGAEDRRLILVEPISSRESYQDMEDFVARVPDPRARELLERAIDGRGAFRRFKDTLPEFPAIRDQWFKFHDARMTRRAIEWLEDEAVVEPAAAASAKARWPDPDLAELSRPFDASAIARAVAGDLRRLYRARLRQVILFGSWARGDAHPESDIDLLVVLDQVADRWQELRNLDQVLWRHSYQNDTVVSALVVADWELANTATPTLIRARNEGLVLA